MASRRLICRDFLRGTCRRPSCRFAHVSPDQSHAPTPIPQSHRPGDKQTPQATKAPKPKQIQEASITRSPEQEIKAWKDTIPLHTKLPRPSTTEKEAIFQRARHFVDSESTRQEVIQTFASEDGLQLVVDLVEGNFKDMNTRTPEVILRTQILAFLETVTHPEVLSLTALKQAVGTIYNVLYGIDGTRAAQWLNRICEVLEIHNKNKSSLALLEASLHAFSHTADLNFTAPSQEQLQAVAKRFEAVFTSMNTEDMDGRLGQSRLHLKHLLRRVETGNSIQASTSELLPKNSSNVAFVPRRETPGGRHNNDFVDICQIKLMPSYDEICYPRTEYLPVNDPIQWHVDGIDGLLDRNFRLLREDTVGQLRDTIHHELMPRSKQKQPPLRRFIYHDARMLNLEFNWLSGLYFGVDFPQPAELAKSPLTVRQAWWETSTRLQPGGLVCLIIQKNLVLFCTVVNQVMSPRRKKYRDPPKKRTEASLWDDPMRASIKLMLVDSRFTNIRLILDLWGSKKPPISVVEFPGVLLPAFEPALKALQAMKLAKNLPFSELFVPWASKNSKPPEILPPSYASEQGYTYNLRCLLDNDADFYVRPDHQSNVQYIQDHSTLDRAQAHALISCLKRKLGLIQGPPGTGKSYTGVALIKVLLANRDVGKTDMGPILCVTYTNHALDQLLEALLDHKVTSQIVRIGSQSKSDKLENFNLHSISKGIPRTKGEKRERWTTAERLSSCEDQFYALDFQREVPTGRLKLHIQQHHIRHYNQLFVIIEDGFIKVTNDASQNIFELWMDSGAESNGRPRSTTELEDISVFEMSQQERRNIYANWCREYREDVDAKVARLVETHGTAKLGYESVHDEMHLRCLAQADVIGVTTSGLARRLEMFRRLSCKFMICEEAGEVLESHLLTAFLPSIEHAILIGDQQQLRPQIQNYNLSSENPRGGAQYSLDVSLFERLVSSNKTPIDCGYSFSALETQRRMHPSIARLVRETLYPRLKDAPSVSKYPEVRGMRKRLFWLDHRSREGGYMDGDVMSTSHWNNFEIEMTVALVSHLVRQGEYKTGDIAVITPYLGQLHKLRQRLATTFAITVGDRDQDNLVQAGYVDNEAQTKHVVRTSLSDTLRVATVDNFQGEEAKIVVVSLVRSNSQNQCGFLRTSNRINVLLSRAQHGMYIIGNSETSRHVPMWAQVVDILEKGQNIGTVLELQCSRHPDTPIKVSKPEDFLKFSPEGGCNQRCLTRLKCGHTCVKKCHSEYFHNAMVCLESCPRPLDGCTHMCPKPCGRPCPDKCMVNIPQQNKVLECGHPMNNIPCWQNQDMSTVRCLARVKKTAPACKHTIFISCHVDVESTEYRCMAQCRSRLPCGHLCKKLCHHCVKIEPENITQDHGTCERRCDRNYSTCSHTCTAICHGKYPCPPCQAPCNVHCGHSKCVRKCYEPCTPCAEEKCLCECPHSVCSMPCAAPCDHIPCSKRCEKKLDCGHQCPSVCGETCPPLFYCQVCGNSDTKNHEVDFIMGQTYKDINLDENPCIFPRCGHFLTIESMDAQMDMATHYYLDADRKPTSIRDSSTPFSVQDIKTCATCRGPLRDIVRYGRLIRRAILDESTKKMILLINQQFVPLATELPKFAQELRTLEGQKKPTWPPVVEIGGGRWQQVKTMREVLDETNPGRWDDILELRERIERYRRDVKLEEQPFERVRNSINVARGRSNTTNSFDPLDDVLKTNGFLQATALLICIDIALLVDFSILVSRVRSCEITLELDLQRTKDDCRSLISKAGMHRRILQQTEEYIYLALIHALERVHCSSQEHRIALAEHSQDAIDRARALCTAHPRQTRGLPQQVDSAEQMYGDTFCTVVTSEERIEVISAMAQDFQGTGRWYYCPNGHPFTIGECGDALEVAFCPECDASVGGEHHQMAEGVRRAEDSERDVGVNFQEEED